MFGLLGDIAKGVGCVVGAVTGIVIGVSTSVICSALNITSEMVKEAIDAGCETYEEIRDIMFHFFKNIFPC